MNQLKTNDYQDKLTVLILEDSPMAMMNLFYMLEKYVRKENIFRAYSYEDAVNFMQTKPVNLIFSDLSMPSKNGMDFIIDFLKPDERFADIPIIVLTGVSTNSLLKSTIKPIVHRYLEKPANISEVQEAIESLSYFQ